MLKNKEEKKAARKAKRQAEREAEKKMPAWRRKIRRDLRRTKFEEKTKKMTEDFYKNFSKEDVDTPAYKKTSDRIVNRMIKTQDQKRFKEFKKEQRKKNKTVMNKK